jgi:hypothetical protein
MTPGSDVNVNTGVVKKYTDSTQWYTGGGYFLEDGNAVGAAVGCYAEGDQHLLTTRSQSLIVGGFASNYGGYNGSIGNQQGLITMTQAQFKDPVNKYKFSIEQVPGNLQVSAGFGDEISGHSIKWVYDNRLRCNLCYRRKPERPSSGNGCRQHFHLR